MRSDQAKTQRWSKKWLQTLRDWLTRSEFSEAKHQHQNPVESRAIKWLKYTVEILLRRTRAPPEAWLYAALYMVDIHNITSDETLD